MIISIIACPYPYLVNLIHFRLTCTTIVLLKKYTRLTRAVCIDFLKYFKNLQGDRLLRGQVFQNGFEWSQPLFTCSKLTIETLEQGVKYVQS